VLPANDGAGGGGLPPSPSWSLVSPSLSDGGAYNPVRPGAVMERRGKGAHSQRALLDVPFRRTSPRYTLRMASRFTRHTNVLLKRTTAGGFIATMIDRTIRGQSTFVYHTAALGIKTRRAACAQSFARCPRRRCGHGRATAPARHVPRWCRRCDCKCPPVRACGRSGDLKPFR
jgi:hypothetical protein